MTASTDEGIDEGCERRIGLPIEGTQENQTNAREQAPANHAAEFTLE